MTCNKITILCLLISLLSLGFANIQYNKKNYYLNKWMTDNPYKQLELEKIIDTLETEIALLQIKRIRESDSLINKIVIMEGVLKAFFRDHYTKKLTGLQNLTRTEEIQKEIDRCNDALNNLEEVVQNHLNSKSNDTTENKPSDKL
jgi:hypothetical protein